MILYTTLADLSSRMFDKKEMSRADNPYKISLFATFAPEPDKSYLSRHVRAREMRTHARVVIYVCETWG
jgi:hypothetical protein